MIASKVDTLRVPGAKLYYEVRGSGPILLLIAAGAGDADSYSRLVEHLTDHYSVVTYDRRGYSRSPLDDPDQPIEINTHSEDIHHLLTALGNEPAFVFGCSIGALIGLDLVVRHPTQVCTLIAHEPPAMQLLSTLEQPPDLLEMYRAEGATEALKQFAASLGVTHNDQHLNLGLPQKNAAIAQHNKETFFKYDAKAVAQYQLDIAALRDIPTQIVFAGGRDGREFFPYRCAVAVADKLGTAIVEFPGTHAGFVDYPQVFAEKMRDVFGN